MISMVLGMRSSEVGCTDFRLILDLKRVLIKVDFPKPLCPGERMRGQLVSPPGRRVCGPAIWPMPRLTTHQRISAR